MIANKLKYKNIGKNGKNIIWQYIFVTLNQNIECFHPTCKVSSKLDRIWLSNIWTKIDYLQKKQNLVFFQMPISRNK